MKTSAASSVSSKAVRRCAIEEFAANWISRRDAGLNSEEMQELNDWLAADVRHADAFAEMEAAWAHFNRPRAEGRGERLLQQVTERATQVKRRNWRIINYATAALAAAAAVLVLTYSPRLSSPPRVAPVASPPSVALLPDRHVLPDGSSVELNAGAQFAVEFSPEKRFIRLMRGEALFEVAKDAGRPFIVAVDRIEVRAVGTAFTVRRARDEVAVLVTEGEVAVDQVKEPPHGAATPSSSSVSTDVPKPVFVSAGRKVAIPLALGAPLPEPERVSREEVVEALAWRTRRVEFSSTPLSEAVALFNRHTRTPLVLGDDSVGALRITGVFWTDDSEGFSRLLVSSLDLKADIDGQGRIILKSPESGLR